MALLRKKKVGNSDHDYLHQFRTFATSEDFVAWQRDRGETTIIYSMQPVVIHTIGYRDAADTNAAKTSRGHYGGLPRGNIHGLFVIFFEEEVEEDDDV